MHPDEARDRFSDALEEELSPEERAAFARTLEAHPALAEEYRDFCAAVSGTRALRRVALHPSTDLLAGARRRLERGHRGRFSRERFADGKQPSRLLPMVLGVVMFVLLAVAVASLLYFDGLGVGPASSSDLFLV